jgi:ABC-type multidrug transport system ATPase subunit
MAIKRVEIRDFLVFKGEFVADFCSGVNLLIGGNGTGKTILLRVLYDKNKHHGVYFTETDLLIQAQDIPTKEQSPMQVKIGRIIAEIIGGNIEWVPGEGSFYTIRTDGTRIPFAAEASGFKKFGLLGLLVASGQLEPGSILFWDEPENSLNPELIPKLVDILLELSRNDIQIFIATHSELLADYFDTIRQDEDKVLFVSLYKDGDFIKANTNDRFDLLSPNKLIEEPVKLYKKKLDRGFGEVNQS